MFNQSTGVLSGIPNNHDLNHRQYDCTVCARDKGGFTSDPCAQLSVVIQADTTEDEGEEEEANPLSNQWVLPVVIGGALSSLSMYIC